MHQARHTRAIKRCRHGEETQILAQALLRVERQRETEIGVERALMELVEQHRRNAVERGIVENHARENALGDDFDAGARRNQTLQTHTQADRLADLLAERSSHARGGGARGKPARLQHDDLARLGERLVQ